ncbi:MAG: hypothetical protein GTN36_04215 [Candidatus Aenigmarchaeota archaeon]|nr:hypothetical protein [Candidatus Aenigmarchaeota archaeon]
MVEIDIWKDKETGEYVTQKSITCGDEHKPPGTPFYPLPCNKEEEEKAKKRYEFIGTIQNQHVIRLKNIAESQRVNREKLIVILEGDKKIFDSKVEEMKSQFYSGIEELKSKIT